MRGCIDVELGPDGSDVTAEILGETIRYRLGAPGRHLVQNSLAVLAAVKLAGADLAPAARRACRACRPKPGAGARNVIDDRQRPHRDHR